MNRWLIVFVLILGTIFSVFDTKVSAMSGGIVISNILTGDMMSASNEFVEIHNTSNEPVDITNWCLYYMNANLSHTSKLTCFGTVNDSYHLFLPASSSILVASNQYASLQGTSSSWSFSATFAQISGHVKLVDSQGNDVDRVGWGYNALGAENVPAESAGAGYMLQRMIVDGIYIDSDDNSQDFLVVPVIMNPIIDNSVHYPDVCPNLGGFQWLVPDGYSLNEFGNCVGEIVDVCENLEGIQEDVPDGYTHVNLICTHDLPKLTLTELHPNPTGGDAGHEFIEIYNPNDEPISLSDYVLVIGTDEKYKVMFDDEMIEANSYKAFYNHAYVFNLVNKSGIVKLVSVDGDVIDQTDQYFNAAEGKAWALINNQWKMTNRPTPGSANLESIDTSTKVAKPASNSTLKPCASNQYRNPETNRCRLISAASSTLGPCGPGEVRHPDTNRCRKTGTSDRVLTPCKENQERNPETNRCRSIVSGTIPEAEHAVMGATTDAASNHYLLVGLAIVTVGALGYVAWEWRFEIRKISEKTLKFLRIRK